MCSQDPSKWRCGMSRPTSNWVLAFLGLLCALIPITIVSCAFKASSAYVPQRIYRKAQFPIDRFTVVDLIQDDSLDACYLIYKTGGHLVLLGVHVCP
jgi:hypothetical protein